MLVSAFWDQFKDKVHAQHVCAQLYLKDPGI